MLTSPSRVDLSRAEVASLSNEALEKVAAVLNAPHEERRREQHAATHDEF